MCPADRRRVRVSTVFSHSHPLQNPTVKREASFWYHLHLWIGWIAAIPIALACLSGAILSFAPEIARWENPELYNLTPTGTPLSTAQVLEAYGQAQPRYQVNYLGIPETPRQVFQAYCIQIRPDGNRPMKVYFNPYTRELIPQDNKFSFSPFITAVHRNLVAGPAGRLVVATSSLLLAITSVIGIILWWPMRGRTLVRVWSRGGALDWHNALGLVVLLPLFVMAVTGISFTWGKQLFPILERIQGYSSQQPAPKVAATNDAVAQSLHTIEKRVEALFPGERITGVQPSHSPKNAHIFIIGKGGSMVRAFMDPYTGELLKTMDGAGTGPVGWYRENFGLLHTFADYGMAARIAWSLFSAVGAFVVATGVWVSIKRWRRARRTG